MATEQYYQQSVANHEGKQDSSSVQKFDESAVTTSENPIGCFDCNICLDHAHDPVVTLCGHLYCWPCIYKWLYFQGASMSPEDKQQCPVCKAGISKTTLVPLYGRGQSSKNGPGDKEALQSFDVPNRPRACGTHLSTSVPNHNMHRNPYRSQSSGQQHYPNNFASQPSILPPALHPMIGMFGEMVYARVFGDSQAASLYWYPNTYQMTTTPRVRRQEMQAEKCLNRVSIFLFCCLIFCLVLF